MDKNAKTPTYEELETILIQALNAKTPGTPEYKAVLENLVLLRKSNEESLSNQFKETIETNRLENERAINELRMELETQKLNLDRDKFEVEKTQNAFKNDLEAKKLALDLKRLEQEKLLAENQQKLNAAAEKNRSRTAFITTAITTLASIGTGIAVAEIAQRGAKDRLETSILFEQNGFISATSSKDVVQNVLRPDNGR